MRATTPRAWTTIRRFHTVGFLALTLVVSTNALATAQTYGPVLTVKDDHFQVNGQPRFLYFVSLFDGLREAVASPSRLDEDLIYIRNTLHADGIRVMPNWWICEEGTDATQLTCDTAGSDTLFNPSDSAHPLRPTQLAALEFLLQRASALGLVVDLTFTHETLSPAITFDGYKAAVIAAATALKGYRNVIIDVQNEFDNSGIALTQTQVAEIREGIQAPSVDPTRVVVASSAMAPTANGVFAVQRGMSAVAHHDVRDSSSWYLETTLASLASAIHSGLCATPLPMYLQEPMAWSTKPGEDNTAGHFTDAARYAKKAGFAAWTFHQRLGYILSSTSFKSKVSEIQSLETELQDLRASVDAQVWGAKDEVYYYHPDALGSVRVVTDERAQILRHHDFLPFGEEQSPDALRSDRMLFTGHERDAETGVDYFGARYYRADLGRFTTVDPGHAGASPEDPQTWNAYAYAGNNPLRNIDPDGRRWFAKNGNAVWVDPNKDGSYTSPGEGWAELDPKNYDPGMSNVAFVDGTLSRIGEDANGGKMITPWMAPEKGLEDTTFSLLGNLWLAGTAVRAAAGAVMGARTATEVAFDITRKGAQVPNIGARLTASEFQANLISSGFRVVRQTVGPNGPVTMLSDGQKLYTIYTATSTGGASAEVRIAGRLVSKIRLSGF